MDILDSTIFFWHRDASRAYNKYDRSKDWKKVGFVVIVLALMFAIGLWEQGSKAASILLFAFDIVIALGWYDTQPRRHLDDVEGRIKLLADTLGITFENMLARKEIESIKQASRIHMITYAQQVLRTQKKSAQGVDLLENGHLDNDFIDLAFEAWDQRAKMLDLRMKEFNSLLLEFELVKEPSSYKVWAFAEALKLPF